MKKANACVMRAGMLKSWQFPEPAFWLSSTVEEVRYERAHRADCQSAGR